MTQETAATNIDEQQTRIPLDEVMLAMDVVDTLRHQDQLVAAELDSEVRRSKLIERIRSIYESQGMDVPEEVIAEGVKALEEDRFKYQPPKRSFSVWLAEIYVERGKWTARLLILVGAVLLIWAAIAVPRYYQRKAQTESYRRNLTLVSDQLAELTGKRKKLAALLAQVRQQNMPQGVAIREDAARILGDIDRDVKALSDGLDEAPEPDTYLKDSERWDGVVAQQQQQLSSMTSRVGAAEGALRALLRLRSVPGKVEQAMARLRNVDVPVEDRQELERLQRRVEDAVARNDEAAARSELGNLHKKIESVIEVVANRKARARRLIAHEQTARSMQLDQQTRKEIDGLITQVKTSMASGNEQVARRAFAGLDRLMTTLEQTYELRIVTGGNQRSGVWRRKDNIRNYYIIVKAVGPDGRTLQLPIVNEEGNQTERVRTFGIRVPKRIYEKVKADKLDNGILDNRLFGRKQRGRRKPDYEFEVSGGTITRW